MAAVEINTVTDIINSSNLKAYYRFESGALTTDGSGNSHTLTAISDPAEADTDFVLSGVITENLSDYYEANNWIACRVYQLAQ